MHIKKDLFVYYQEIKTTILDRQHPISGLLPASTAITAHGDYTDAWVRDNVYSILAVWGLALAFRQHAPLAAERYILEQSTVKLMRALLLAMMRQAHKVEKFKKSRQTTDALHAKYQTSTGNTVVGDQEWGHLQLDATALFLLILSQMSATGLRIIFTTDEVDFIQNLVYYLKFSAYVADYGIWERGNKMNHGEPEHNASSIGMVKSALETVDKISFFQTGRKGTAIKDIFGSIFVEFDDIAAMRDVLTHLLPAESASKESDAALLSIIGFPGFAVENSDLIEKTFNKIKQLLEGNYGCKRFLLDGHQTVLENCKKLYYEAADLPQFSNIECEWPLFFAYLCLYHHFANQKPEASHYLAKLYQVAVKNEEGLWLLPELYKVAANAVEQEKIQPHSQTRHPNDNIPLVWAQSLFFLCQLLEDNWLNINDLDPLQRNLQQKSLRRTRLHLVIIAESPVGYDILQDLGIPCDLVSQSVMVKHSRSLRETLSGLGANARLGLSGRPPQEIGLLSTAKSYHFSQGKVVFLPNFLDISESYLTLDSRWLVKKIEAALAYIFKHWQETGHPLLVLSLPAIILENIDNSLLNLLRKLSNSRYQKLPVVAVTLEQALLKGKEEYLQHLTLADDDPEQSSRYSEVSDWQKLYQQALTQRDWKTLRCLTEKAQKADNQLEISVAKLLAKRKQLILGKAYAPENILRQPLPSKTIFSLICAHYQSFPGEAALIQEILLYLALLSDSIRDFLSDTLSIHVGQLLHFIIDSFAKKQKLLPEAAIENILSLPPADLLELLQNYLLSYRDLEKHLYYIEKISTYGTHTNVLERLKFQEDFNPALQDAESWEEWRRLRGIANARPVDFYQQLWNFLHITPGLVIADRHRPENRLDSKTLLASTTAGEVAFALIIEERLNRITAPEYRQLTIEALAFLGSIYEQQSNFRLADDMVVDVLIGHAVRLRWQRFNKCSDTEYREQKSQAWKHIYRQPPHIVANALKEAFSFLLIPHS
jgi:hypothetical protein